MHRKSSPDAHQPFLWEAEGSDTGVLLVHGVLGSPNQFEALARRLFESGCTVMAILLPGHGGGAQDFAAARAQDWQQAVHEAAASLRERCKRVFLLGHSMGGLLAIGEAVSYGADGLILLSVPMRLKMGIRSLRMSLRVLWGDPARDDDKAGAYRRAFSVQAGSLWQYLQWAAPYGELMRLMRSTRRSLGRVSQPVLIAQSKQDETVSWRSADIFKRELSAACAVEVLMLSRSAHSYHPPDEAEALYGRVCGFIRDRAK